MNAEYWAVSSKTGDCVNNFFNRLAALAFEMNLQNLLECKSEKAFIGNPLCMYLVHFLSCFI